MPPVNTDTKCNECVVIGSLCRQKKIVVVPHVEDFHNQAGIAHYKASDLRHRLQMDILQKQLLRKKLQVQKRATTLEVLIVF